LEEARPPRIDATQPFVDAITADGGRWVRRLAENAGSKELFPITKALTTEVKGTSAEALSAALEKIDQYRSDVLMFMKTFDALVCPVDASLAFKYGQVPETVNSYAIPFSITGQPAAVVRVGTSAEGLPIGVQIIARKWREDVALAVARHLEMSLGGWVAPQGL
jgi:amidase